MKHLKGKKKILAVLCVLTAVILGFWNLNDDKDFIGEVEGVTVSHSAEVSGKILQSSVELGSKVKKGDIIAVIDDTNQRYMVEQLSLNLEKVKASQGNSKLGSGGTADNNYSAAKANYDSAAAVAEKAAADYEKAKGLYAESAVSKDSLDVAKVAYEKAMGAAESARAQLKNTSDKTAGSVTDIDLRLLKSQLEQQQEILEKYTITAACDGTVMSRNYGVGDMVAQGYDIADISSQKERYAVVYFPEEKLDTIRCEQKVKVTTSEKSTKGIVKYIDVEAQYTPKELQTPANRNQECVMVKVLLPEAFSVNVGQQVKVSFNE